MGDNDLRKCKCENIGCNRVFKWGEELKRHKRECNHPKFQKIAKYKAERMFWYLNCQQKFTKQSNASCHVENWKGKKQAVYHTCSVCSKMFQYKSYLKTHMKSHKKSTTDDNLVPSLAFETAGCAISSCWRIELEWFKS